jgi:hypothetical protein
LAIGQIVAANFSFQANSTFASSSFVTFGDCRVDSSGIRITEQGDALGNLVFYRNSLPVANGFTTSFVIDITNCDIAYGGADGFAFIMFPEIPARDSYLVGGSGISLTSLNNFAAVPFLLGSDYIGFCGLNSSSSMGQGSLFDKTDYCSFNNTLVNVLKDLRCTGAHTIAITFTPPDFWEVTIDGTNIYTGSLNISGLLDWNYNAYVGFSGGVAAGYMNQYVTEWSLTATPGCLGACDPIATCTNDYGVVCECPAGYFGDGSTCAVIEPPGADIVPILECYEDMGEGIYRAHFGYQNNEARLVSIPQGPNNQLIGATTNSLTTVFKTGRSSFYPLSAFQHDFSNTNSITWHLTDYDVVVNVADTSKLCPLDLKVELQFYTSTEIETDLIISRLAQQLLVSDGRITLSSLEYLNPTKKRSGVTVADLEIEIAAANSTTQGEPSAADAVEDLVNVAQNAATIEEIVNPEQSDPTREFISAKPLPTGVETEGQPIIPPAVPTSKPSRGVKISGYLVSLVSSILALILVIL